MTSEYDIIEDINGTFWYLPGTETLHRLNGPARIFTDKQELYYIEGRRLTKEEWLQEVKENYPSSYCYDGKLIEFNGQKYQLKLLPDS